jgi:intermembrane space import and assembly protein 40
LEEGEGEESSSAAGAFDPVTGKINWDCPCLGGMAYGPCGTQFREAFSCFVFSEVEPKGMDCVEKFKAMQDCFRENPDLYGDGTHHHPPPPQLPWRCPRLTTDLSFYFSSKQKL